MNNTDLPRLASETLRVSSLQSKINDLELAKGKLSSYIENLEKKIVDIQDDQKDVYYLLNRKCDESYELINNLQDQLLIEQAERADIEAAAQKKYDDLQSKFDIEEARYRQRISQLEQTASNKDHILSNDEPLRKLLKSLDDERRQYSKNMADVENRHAQEKERMRKEYELTLNELKSLPRTTPAADDDKRKIAALDTVNEELKVQTNHIDFILQMDTKTVERDRQLRRELSLAQTNEKIMLERLSQHRSAISDLKARIAILQEAHDQLKLVTIGLEKQGALDSNKQGLWRLFCDAYDEMVSRRQLMLKPSDLLADSMTPPQKDKILILLIRTVMRKYPNRFSKELKLTTKKNHKPYPDALQTDSGFNTSDSSLPIIGASLSNTTPLPLPWLYRRIPKTFSISVQTSEDCEAATVDTLDISQSLFSFHQLSPLSTGEPTGRLRHGPTHEPIFDHRISSSGAAEQSLIEEKLPAYVTTEALSVTEQLGPVVVSEDIPEDITDEISVGTTRKGTPAPVPEKALRRPVKRRPAHSLKKSVYSFDFESITTASSRSKRVPSLARRESIPEHIVSRRVRARKQSLLGDELSVSSYESLSSSRKRDHGPRSTDTKSFVKVSDAVKRSSKGEHHSSTSKGAELDVDSITSTFPSVCDTVTMPPVFSLPEDTLGDDISNLSSISSVLTKRP